MFAYFQGLGGPSSKSVVLCAHMGMPAAGESVADKHARAVALVLARYFIGMLVGGVAVLWVAAWYYLRKPRGAHPLHPVRVSC